MHRVRLIGDPEVPRGTLSIRLVDEEQEVRVSPEEVEDYRKQLDEPDIKVVVA